MKGIAIWVLGFFTLFAVANVINSVIMWFTLGPEGTFILYPFSGFAFPVYGYLLLSVLVTLAFLGGTTHMLVGQLSNTEKINAIAEKTTRLEDGQQSQQKTLDGVQAKVFLVDESVERTRRELTNRVAEQGNDVKECVTDVKQCVNDGHETQRKMIDGLQGRVFLLDESMKGVKDELNGQTDVIKSVNANLVDKVDPQLAEIKESSTKQLYEIDNGLRQIRQRDKKTLATIAKQAGEISEVRLKLEKLEAELIKPKPMLTSRSNVEDVKGIGPGKGTELREMGIPTAGELVMADTKLVAERMGTSEKTVEKLQGRAQLAMIPGLKEKDLFLLEELDITDRKSLAKQDPIDLSKKVNAIFKVNLAQGKVAEGDKPTIEELESWIKFVRP